MIIMVSSIVINATHAEGNPTSKDFHRSRSSGTADGWVHSQSPPFNGFACNLLFLLRLCTYRPLNALNSSPEVKMELEISRIRDAAANEDAIDDDFIAPILAVTNSNLVYKR
jgi:hypothetical protein